MEIQEFLNSNPSIADVLKYVDTEAARIVKERLKSSKNCHVSRGVKYD